MSERQEVWRYLRKKEGKKLLARLQAGDENEALLFAKESLLSLSTHYVCGHNTTQESKETFDYVQYFNN